MDLGTYQSIDAELWSGDIYFGVIQKDTVAIFEILIFPIFLGVKVQIFAIFTEFWTLTP